MNLASLSVGYLRARPLNTALSLILTGLGLLLCFPPVWTLV